MVLRYLIVFVLIIFLCPLLSATIINIPADYPAIQQGIDASTDGDTVLVQPAHGQRDLGSHAGDGSQSGGYNRRMGV